MTTRRDEYLAAAATAELGEDAGLGAVTELTAIYAAAPEMLHALQELSDFAPWGGTNFAAFTKWVQQTAYAAIPAGRYPK
jgi:hypothetical protein